MRQVRGGLGRGLGALIPVAGPVSGRQPPVQSDGDEGSEAAVRFTELPLSAVAANPRQPRHAFDEEALAELVASVREVGVLQPVVVRPAGPGRYELVMGERRLRAARAAGLSAIPAVVRETPDDALLRDALLENLHRSELNPLEEAAAYAALLDDFAVTHEELARRLGRSRAHVSNTLRLVHLPAAVQRRVAAGVLSAGHARALLSLTDPTEAERLAQRIVAEGLSVRATEEAVHLSAGTTRRASRRAGVPEPELAEIAARLSDALDTRVRLQGGRRRGRIVVEFGSADDLHRLADLLAGRATPGAGLVAQPG